MQTVRNEEERNIWADACQLRRKYAHIENKDGYGLCAMIVDSIRLRVNHHNHPMAELLADSMRDELKALWAAGNQSRPGS